MSLDWVEIFIAVNSFFKGMGYSSDNKLYLIMLTIAFFFAAVNKLFKEKFTIKEFIIIFLLVTIGLINFIFGHSSVVLLTALTLSLLKNVNINTCLKVTLFSRIGGSIALIIGVLIGAIKSTTINMWRINQFVVRNTIGGIHSNILQLNLVIIILLLIYVYRDKINFIEYIILGLVNWSLYLYTLSRTGMNMGMASIIIGCCIKYFHFFRKIVMIISKYIYLLLSLFSIFIAYFYNDSLNNLNQLFDGRLSYMHSLVQGYHISLFGINKNNFTNINIDNGYISLLYIGGLLAFILISYLMITESKILYNENNLYALICILILSIYSFSESFLPNIFVNFSLFFLAPRIYRNNVVNSQNILKRTGE